MTFKLILSTAIFCTFHAFLYAQEKPDAPARFTVHVQFTEPLGIDSLYLRINNRFFSVIVGNEQVIAAGKDANNGFTFRIRPDQSAGQFDIRRKAKRNSSQDAELVSMPFVLAQPWQSEDSIVIRVSKRPLDYFSGSFPYQYEMKFSGKGARRYQARYDARIAYYEAGFASSNSRLFDSAGARYQDPAREKIHAALSILELHKSKISLSDYQLIKADILAENFKSRYNALRFALPQQTDTAALARSSGPLASEMDSLIASVPEHIAQQSFDFIRFLACKLEFDNQFATAKTDQQIDLVIKHYQGPLRDRLLTVLVQNRRSDPRINELYERVDRLVMDQDSKTELRKMAATLTGIDARDFELQDAGGNMVRLSEFKGKVVFIDVWFTGCGACAHYYKNVLKSAEQQLDGDDQIVFVTVSADTQKKLWLKSLSTENYTGGHSINTYTMGEGLKHDWTAYYDFESLPKMLIIDKKGRLHRIFNNGLDKAISTSQQLVSTLNEVKAMK
ncbi:TlpA family protein disulfide reductase [Dyadobacter psychrophilus]|uniref:Redoxin n=1 Tax=Dyadobacter psychrophilus TaxID=651661 RepID=A0A1T5HD59_9BACT|nr:thioredoxin family protein [Dyadobacter psychrophilus]SKC18520.1 Redoxin [Dyadobacter psychrophilus]